jgi:hypothetical protein
MPGFDSLFCGFSVFPAPARGWPAGIMRLLFTCCGPCAMLACRANTTDGFLIVASVSYVARHWLCAFSASRM